MAIINLPAPRPNPIGESLRDVGGFVSQLMIKRQDDERRKQERIEDKSFMEKTATKTAAIKMLEGLQADLGKVDPDTMPKLLNTVNKLFGLAMPGVDSKALTDVWAAGANTKSLIERQATKAGQVAIDTAEEKLITTKREQPSVGFQPEKERLFKEQAAADIKLSGTTEEARRKAIPTQEERDAALAFTEEKTELTAEQRKFLERDKGILTAKKQLENDDAIKGAAFKQDFATMFGSEMTLKDFVLSAADKQFNLRQWSKQQMDNYNNLRTKYGLQHLIPEIIPSSVLAGDFLPGGDKLGGVKWGKLGFPEALKLDEEDRNKAQSLLGAIPGS